MSIQYSNSHHVFKYLFKQRFLTNLLNLPILNFLLSIASTTKSFHEMIYKSAFSLAIAKTLLNMNRIWFAPIKSWWNTLQRGCMSISAKYLMVSVNFTLVVIFLQCASLWFEISRRLKSLVSYLSSGLCILLVDETDLVSLRTKIGIHFPSA